MKCERLALKPIKLNQNFIDNFENKVVDTIKKYKMLSKKDKILVAVSGGKDSTAILSILHNKGYNLFPVIIDSEIDCYSEENLSNLAKFCEELGVKLNIISLTNEFGHSLKEIRTSLQRAGIKLKPCSICGVLRRYLLNITARKNKCNIVVTGHNLNDEAEAIMMNILYNRIHLLARLGPKPGIKRDKRFIPRVKPLYFISEEEVIKYCLMKKYKLNYAHCPCSVESYRKSIKDMINSLPKDAKYNIVNYLLNILPKLQKEYKTDKEIKHCEKCGEPCIEKYCRACQIIDLI